MHFIHKVQYAWLGVFCQTCIICSDVCLSWYMFEKGVLSYVLASGMHITFILTNWEQLQQHIQLRLYVNGKRHFLLLERVFFVGSLRVQRHHNVTHFFHGIHTTHQYMIRCFVTCNIVESTHKHFFKANRTKTYTLQMIFLFSNMICVYASMQMNVLPLW